MLKLIEYFIEYNNTDNTLFKIIIKKYTNK